MRNPVATARKTVLWHEVVSAWLLCRLLQPLCRRPFLPRAMHMLPTYRCNARCIMCGIWEEAHAADRELTLADFERLLRDRLFSRMEFVGISGGEPFLRNDLPALVRVLGKCCPRLKRVSLTTNGILSDRIGEALPVIAADCRESGVLLDVSVSLHGLGDRLTHIYGVEDAFARIVRTVEELKRRRAGGELTFSFNGVLLRDNLDHAQDLARWAGAQGIPISFVVGEQRARFRNETRANVYLDEADRPRLLAFLSTLDQGLSPRYLSPLRYRELIRLLEGRGDRTLPCYYALGGLVLGHDGQLYYCSHSRSIGNGLARPAHELYYDAANLAYRRSELLGAECRRCPPYTLTRWEIEANAWGVARALLTERWRRRRQPCREECSR